MLDLYDWLDGIDSETTTHTQTAAPAPEPTRPAPKWLSTAQAAKVANVTRRAVTYWASQGAVRCERHGTWLYLWASDVEAQAALVRRRRLPPGTRTRYPSHSAVAETSTATPAPEPWVAGSATVPEAPDQDGWPDVPETWEPVPNFSEGTPSFTLGEDTPETAPSSPVEPSEPDPRDERIRDLEARLEALQERLEGVVERAESWREEIGEWYRRYEGLRKQTECRKRRRAERDAIITEAIRQGEAVTREAIREAFADADDWDHLPAVALPYLTRR